MSTEERKGLRRRRRVRGSDRSRAIYLLPNLITSAAVLFGFWSIISSIHHQFDRAALFIVIAGICDTLDGRIARATHSESQFGVEYDSLSDMLSFGLAPALLVYTWALTPLGNRGWLIAALFAMCAALRLARFNVRGKDAEGTRYQGMPTTVAGGIVASTVWFIGWLGLNPPFDRPLAIAIITGFSLLALLMVSAVPYPSTSMIRIGKRQQYPALVAFVLAVIAIGLHHEPVLFLVSILFLASGPTLWLMDRRRKARAGDVQEDVAIEKSSDAG